MFLEKIIFTNNNGTLSFVRRGRIVRTTEMTRKDIDEIVKEMEVHRATEMEKVVNGNGNVIEVASGEKMVEKIDMTNASDTTGIKMMNFIFISII